LPQRRAPDDGGATTTSLGEAERAATGVTYGANVARKVLAMLKTFPSGDNFLTPRSVTCGITCGVMNVKELRFPINPIFVTKCGKRTFSLFAPITPERV
jgi:hypothetical protein